MLNQEKIFSIFGNKKLLLFAIIISFIVKLLGDFGLYFFFGSFTFDQNLFWKFITTAVLATLILGYFIAILKPKVQSYDSTFLEKFINDQNTLLIFYLISLGLTIFLANFRELLNNYQISLDLISQIFGWFYLILGFITAWYFYQWINVLKNKDTNLFIKISKIAILIIFINIFIIRVLNYFFDFDSFSSFVNFIETSLFVITPIFSFKICQNYDWLKNINYKQRYKLLIVSATIVVIGFFTITSDYYEDIKASINHIFPNLYIFLLFVIINLITYQFRLFWQTLRSKKVKISNENVSISELERFNRYVLDSNITNRSELHCMFLDSLIRVVNVDFAWIEQDKKNDFLKCEEYKNIDIQLVEYFNKHKFFRDFVEQSYTINTAATLEQIGFSRKYPGYRMSLIVIPIYDGNKKIGNIILGRNKEYAFSLDEIQIINAFATNYAIIIQNTRLMQEAIEKERYEFELNLARGIQRKIIPESLPLIENYSCAGISIPAHELGGDYYDFVYLNNSKPTLLIADVSGKGTSAALYMSQLKGIIVSLASSVDNPKDLVIRLNEILCNSTEKQIFITLSAITVDSHNGNLSFVRAGHTPLIVKKSTQIETLKPKGIALGVVSGNLFNDNLEVIQFNLNEGDFCFAYTDGLDELQNNDGNELGLDNISNSLLNLNPKTADDIIEYNLHKIEEYKNGNKLVDDLTMLTILFNHKKEY